MPEIKHAFSQGKMNKDLDERLVPNGQYRNAMNVQVSTSEGADTGTLQNILGNSKISNIDVAGLFCVGSIADEKTNAVYWFVGNEFSAQPTFTVTGGGPIADENISVSMILQYRNGIVKPVIVDQDAFTVGYSSHGYEPSKRKYYIELHTGSIMINYIREGMSLKYASDYTDQLSYTSDNIVAEIDKNTNRIYMRDPFASGIQAALNRNNVLNFLFADPIDSVLGFQKDRLITGINIIPASEELDDDLLFWTDNYSEPKKINIKYSIEGTNPNMLEHTLLKIKDQVTLGLNDEPLKLEHVTVIRRPPTNKPKLELFSSKREGTTIGISNHDFTNIQTANEFNLTITAIGGIGDLNNSTPNKMPFDLKSNDTLWLRENDIGETFPISNFDYKVRILEVISNDPSNTSALFQVELLEEGIDPPKGGEVEFNVQHVDSDKELFKFKFPRFSFRYKYRDGEYSAFGPFSEVAFIPGRFDYHPRKGYNLGMINNLRKLYIKDIVPDDIPKDVIEVDILYKESNSPNIYVVDTVSRRDEPEAGEIFNTWDKLSTVKTVYQGDYMSPATVLVGSNRGVYEITSDTIYAVLPENQFLRPWDNVPRKALAQEVTGNRLIYGNYLQNYNLTLIDMVGNKSNYKPQFSFSFGQYIYEDMQGITREDSLFGHPGESLKSIREYQIGITFMDKYGRETPIITSRTGSLKVPKDQAAKYNQLKIALQGDPPAWADSYKFYIKEVSNEYYNLAQSGVYDAEDGCAWISFPSSDRSKLDIDTFLILKKSPGTSEIFKEDNRYKVLAIENEAPEYIKSFKLRRGSDKHQSKPDDPNAANEGYGIFNPNDGPPINGNDYFRMSKTVLGHHGLGAAHEMFTKQLNNNTRRWYVQFEFSGIKTDYLEITDINYFPHAPDGDTTIMVTEEIDGVSTQIPVEVDFDGKIEVLLSKPMDSSVDFIWDASLNDGSGGVKDGVRVNLFEERIEHKPEFDGRFFVKIAQDELLIGQFEVMKQQEYGIVAERKIYHFNRRMMSSGAYGSVNYPFPTMGARFGVGDYSGLNRGYIGLNCGFDGSDTHPGGSYYGAHQNKNPGSNKAAQYYDGYGSTTGSHPDYGHDKRAGLGSFRTGEKSGYDRGWQNVKRDYNEDQEIWGVFLVGYHQQTYSRDALEGHPQLSVLSDITKMRSENVFKQAKLVWESVGRAVGSPSDAIWFIDGTVSDMQVHEGFEQNASINYGRLWNPAQPLGEVRISEKEPSKDSRYIRRIFGNVDGRFNTYRSRGISSWSKSHWIDLCFGGYHAHEDNKIPGGSDNPNWDGKNYYPENDAHWKSAHLNIDKGRYAAEARFIKGLTPGDKIRWKEDPTQTIYTLQNVEKEVFFNYAGVNSSGSIENDKTRGSSSDPLYINGFWGGWQALPHNFRTRFRLKIDQKCMWNPISDYGEGLINGGLELTLTTTKGTIETELNGDGVRVAKIVNDETVYSSSSRLIELTGIIDDTVAEGLGTLQVGMVLIEAQTPGGTSVTVNKHSNYNDTTKHFPMIENIEKVVDVNNNITYQIRLANCGWGYYGASWDDNSTNTGAKNVYQDFGAGYKLKFAQRKMNGFSKNTDSWRQTQERDGIEVMKDFSTYALAYGSPAPGAYNIGGFPKAVGYTLQVLKPIYSESVLPENPAIWETEPRESSDIDIYHEASKVYPIKLNSPIDDVLHDEHVIPVGSTVTLLNEGEIDNESILDNTKSWTYPIDMTQPNTAELTTDPVNPFTPEMTGATVTVTGFSSVINIKEETTVLRVENISGVSSKIILDKPIVANTNVQGATPTPSTNVGLVNVDFSFSKPLDVYVKSIEGNRVELINVNESLSINLQKNNPLYGKPDTLRFRNGINWIDIDIDKDVVSQNVKGEIAVYLKNNTYNNRRSLDWFNCYSFGNGVESNRIGDNFNGVMMDKGARVSTISPEPYQEERRSSGLIYSGIFNSTAGINNLNQFIQAEKITKDLNPEYGTIQKLHARNTDLIALCEDKVLNILANKDAVFNADGNQQLTATERVLGQAVPYVGEYGISKNPESFSSEAYRCYFSDKQRGAILRLSRDGLTPISDAGMRDWFLDNLSTANKIIGNYDERKREYNITLKRNTENNSQTLSYSEDVKGWTSFKSFIPEQGISVANNYYTIYRGELFKHHSNAVHRNRFYEHFNPTTSYTPSSVDVLLNDNPNLVKTFQTINYEGSQAKKIQNLEDGEYHNLENKRGWQVDWLVTDLQNGTVNDFVDKEGMWYGYISGEETTADNLDSSEFSTQGLASEFSHGIEGDVVYGCTDPQATNYFPDANIDDGSCSYAPGAPVYGCTDPTATNYNPSATIDNGSCTYPGPVYGCTDPIASNYDPLATVDDNSCIYPPTLISGCTDPVASNYDPNADVDDGSCVYQATGVTPTLGPPVHIYGCTDPLANNYDSTANVDDGTCSYTTAGATQGGPTVGPPVTVYGCTDPLATNYNSAATVDDGTCIYPATTYDLIVTFDNEFQSLYPILHTHPNSTNYKINGQQLTTNNSPTLVIPNVIEPGVSWQGTIQVDIEHDVVYTIGTTSSADPFGQWGDNLFLSTLRVYGMMPNTLPGSGIVGAGTPTYSTIWNSLAAQNSATSSLIINKAGIFEETTSFASTSSFPDFSPPTGVTFPTHASLMNSMSAASDPLTLQEYYQTDTSNINGWEITVDAASGDVWAVESSNTIQGVYNTEKITLYININIEAPSGSTQLAQDLEIIVPIHQDTSVLLPSNYA